jgi:hypothetical protein
LTLLFRHLSCWCRFASGHDDNWWLFQVYHDDIDDGINEPHEGHDEQWGGLFDTVEAAEKELLRLPPSLEAITLAAVRGPDRQ